MKPRKVVTLLTGLSLLFSAGQSSLLFAHGDEKHTTEPTAFIGMETAPVKRVQQFHQALKAGDEAIVKQLLAEDVLIYEGGNAERSLADYASHHMGADMAYLKNLTITLKELQVKVVGDIAISTAISHATGEYKGKQIDSTAMETLVLSKQHDGSWKIIHIHWS